MILTPTAFLIYAAASVAFTLASVYCVRKGV